jgi:hypothetical protein
MDGIGTSGLGEAVGNADAENSASPSALVSGCYDELYMSFMSAHPNYPF